MSSKKEIRNLDEIKDSLLSRKSALEEEFSDLNSDKIVDDIQDQAEQATTTAFETLKTSLHNNEYEEYKMIIKALDMIEEGTYGKCTDCNEAIGIKRLMSRPNAARCLICQESLEDQDAGTKANTYL